MENRKQYMVFIEGGVVPKKVHESRADAHAEADRLARLYPNKMVRVLLIVSEMCGEIVVKGVDYDYRTKTI